MPLDLIGLGTNERGDDVEPCSSAWGFADWAIWRGLTVARLAAVLEVAASSSFGWPEARVPRRVQLRGRKRRYLPKCLELEYGIETLEPLDFVMRAMIERLTERLALRGLVGSVILRCRSDWPTVAVTNDASRLRLRPMKYARC